MIDFNNDVYCDILFDDVKTGCQTEVNIMEHYYHVKTMTYSPEETVSKFKQETTFQLSYPYCTPFRFYINEQLLSTDEITFRKVKSILEIALSELNTCKDFTNNESLSDILSYSTLKIDQGTNYSDRTFETLYHTHHIRTDVRRDKGCNERTRIIFNASAKIRYHHDSPCLTSQSETNKAQEVLFSGRAFEFSISPFVLGRVPKLFMKAKHLIEDALSKMEEIEKIKFIRQDKSIVSADAELISTSISSAGDSIASATREVAKATIKSGRKTVIRNYSLF